MSIKRAIETRKKQLSTMLENLKIIRKSGDQVLIREAESRIALIKDQIKILEAGGKV